MDRSGWDATSWVDDELASSTFRDERLGRGDVRQYGGNRAVAEMAAAQAATVETGAGTASMMGGVGSAIASVRM
jgi:hypothetical protein